MTLALIPNAGLLSKESTQANIETLQDTLLILLSAILEKMPRVTGNDQVAASIEAGTLTSVGTVTTVTTVNTVSSVSNAVNLAAMGSKYITGDNVNLSGVQHIYNGIIVT